MHCVIHMNISAGAYPSRIPRIACLYSRHGQVLVWVDLSGADQEHQFELPRSLRRHQPPSGLGRGWPPVSRGQPPIKIRVAARAQAMSGRNKRSFRPVIRGHSCTHLKEGFLFFPEAPQQARGQRASPRILLTQRKTVADETPSVRGSAGRVMSPKTPRVRTATVWRYVPRPTPCCCRATYYVLGKHARAVWMMTPLFQPPG